MSQTLLFKRVCVIGVGLIGGSLARDLRAHGLADRIVGCSRKRENLDRALALGVIDEGEPALEKAVAGADLVVLAMPLGAMRPVIDTLAPHLRDDAVLTDVGIAKCSVIEDARSAFGVLPSGFVPAHPIAGTERSGVEASFEGLFEQRRVILTPVAETSAGALERVRRMWQAVGADVVEMDAEHHDLVLAATSHLPHMLAYTLVDVLGGMEERREMFRYAAGGFKDFTRIASSDPQMWHDICFANRDALVGALEHFGTALESAADAVRNGDGEALKALFTRAKTRRDRYAEGN